LAAVCSFHVTRLKDCSPETLPTEQTGNPLETTNPNVRNSKCVAFLKFVDYRSSQITIELHTADHDRAPSLTDFERECKTYLPRHLPDGITLIVRRWKERTGDEGLHNRYILTDVGGVKFSWGIGEGDLGTSDDVSLLDVENYRFRMQQYDGPKHAFDLDGQFKIVGKG
jgi:hypothetical protein